MALSPFAAFAAASDEAAEDDSDDQIVDAHDAIVEVNGDHFSTWEEEQLEKELERQP